MIPARPLVLGSLIAVGPLALILGARWGFLSISSFLVGTLAIALVRTRQVVGPGPVEDRVWFGQLKRALPGAAVLVGTAAVPCVILFGMFVNFLAPQGCVVRIDPATTLLMIAAPSWPCSLLVRRWLGWQTATPKPPRVRTRREPESGPIQLSLLGLMVVVALAGVVLASFRAHPGFGALVAVTIGLALFENRRRWRRVILNPDLDELCRLVGSLVGSAILVAGAGLLSVSFIGDIEGLGLFNAVNPDRRLTAEMGVFAALFGFSCVLVRRCIRWSFRMDEA